jgi:hypothetical protein
MNAAAWRHLDAATRLAILLIFVMVWGFAGISKVSAPVPAWFVEKFQPTLLGQFPGAAGSYWLLAAAELAAFGLGVVGLVRLEFLRPVAPGFGLWMLVTSLFVFGMLGFGLWLTRDFNGGFQQFLYFAGTLVALQTYARGIAPRTQQD